MKVIRILFCAVIFVTIFCPIMAILSPIFIASAIICSLVYYIISGWKVLSYEYEMWRIIVQRRSQASVFERVVFRFLRDNNFYPYFVHCFYSGSIIWRFYDVRRAVIIDIDGCKCDIYVNAADHRYSYGGAFDLSNPECFDDLLCLLGRKNALSVK